MLNIPVLLFNKVFLIKMASSLSYSLNDLMPIILKQLEDGQTVKLTVKGVSMEPFLIDGRDAIIMEAPGNNVPRVGDLYMFRRNNGSYAMHRLWDIASDGTYVFVGDNQIQTDKGITESMIMAYVPRVIRNGREINCERGLLRSLLTLRVKFRLRFPRTVLLLHSLFYMIRHPVAGIRKIMKKLRRNKHG